MKLFPITVFSWDAGLWDRERAGPNQDSKAVNEGQLSIYGEMAPGALITSESSYQMISDRIDELLQAGKLDIFCGQHIFATYARNEMVSVSSQKNILENNYFQPKKHYAGIRWNPNRFDLIETHELSSKACAVTLLDKLMQKVIWVASAEIKSTQVQQQPLNKDSLLQEDRKELEQLVESRSLTSDLCVIGISCQDKNMASEQTEMLKLHGFQGGQESTTLTISKASSSPQEGPESDKANVHRDVVFAAIHPESGIEDARCHHLASGVDAHLYAIASTLNQQPDANVGWGEGRLPRARHATAAPAASHAGRARLLLKAPEKV